MLKLIINGPWSTQSKMPSSSVHVLDLFLLKANIKRWQWDTVKLNKMWKQLQQQQNVLFTFLCFHVLNSLFWFSTNFLKAFFNSISTFLSRAVRVILMWKSYLKWLHFIVKLPFDHSTTDHIHILFSFPRLFHVHASHWSIP